MSLVSIQGYLAADLSNLPNLPNSSNPSNPVNPPNPSHPPNPCLHLSNPHFKDSLDISSSFIREIRSLLITFFEKEKLPAKNKKNV